MHDEGRLIDEQIAYYRARAAEYDDWFFRRGRYDHGVLENAQWTSEADTLVKALREFKPRGHVLELACGTGLFTKHLLQDANSITAVDSSSEAIEINRNRCQDFRVQYLQANLFEWTPPEQFDVVFFSFWLSHVPAGRFAAFWELVRNSLAPGGRVFLIDSLYEPKSTARNHQLRGPEATSVTRLLDDGRQFEIVKVFYQPVRLMAELDSLGWESSIATTGRHFLYGHCRCR